MKRTIIFIFLIFCVGFQINAQQPLYPELNGTIKRIDLKLPKIKDEKDYKVEIRFGMNLTISECENPTSFGFNKSNIKQLFGLPHRYLYYSIDGNQPTDYFSTNNVENCDKTKKVTKKVLSDQNIFMEYYQDFPTPFFIPKNWTLEYRIWKVNTEYKTLE